MPHESLKDATLLSGLRELFADLADLVQKEIRLARAEVTQAISNRVQAGVWMGVAGFLGLIALLLVVQAIVFGIASFGIALHWASLLVAVILGLIAAAVFFYGRSLATGSLTPKRTLHQVEQDINTMREQLT
jgi:uncharacterized membrane protein YqjE